jgi:hypothetical protein
MPKHTLEQGKNQHNGPPEGDRRLSQQGRNGDTPTRLVRQEDGVLIAQRLSSNRFFKVSSSPRYQQHK